MCVAGGVSLRLWLHYIIHLMCVCVTQMCVRVCHSGSTGCAEDDAACCACECVAVCVSLATRCYCVMLPYR